jgi:hypothetical protein
MASRNYIVSAADAGPGQVAALAERLRAAGFEVAQQLETIGVIVGCADEALVAQLRNLPGVRSIEEEQILHSSTPDSDAG